MKFVLAPDSFKESMTAKEVCQAMAQGIKKADPAAQIISVPMADGGEGTTAALVEAMHGTYFQKNVTGPITKKVKAQYGFLKNKTAIIETAQASGLMYVPRNNRTPQTIKNATTYGTGELIKAALNKGAKKIIIGLGGSATNDGGSGLAQALGVKFLDKTGNVIVKKMNGALLSEVNSLDITQIDQRLAQIPILLASDVTNPLTGLNGASKNFGKQKGADEATQNLLDRNLIHYTQLIKIATKKEIADIPGSGAAGGLAASLLAFTKSQLYPGVQVIARENNLAEKIKNTDYVFTGEGGTDWQTQYGKTPSGVAKIAKKYNIPVISLAGYLGKGIDQLYQDGFTAFFGILAKAEPLEKALKVGSPNISRTCENIVRLLQIK